jgi:hypothetical protein
MKIVGPWVINKGFVSGYANRPRILNGKLGYVGDIMWIIGTDTSSWIDEAMKREDKFLTDSGYTIVSQEEWDKYLVLL